MNQRLNPEELFRVFSLLNSQLNLDRLLPGILDLALQLTGAERAFLMVRDRKGLLSIKAAQNNKGQTLEEEDFQGSTSIMNKVLESGQSLYLSSADISGAYSSAASVRKWNLQSAICIPLRHQQAMGHPEAELMGVLYLDSSVFGEPLPREQLEITESLANHVGLSISNARMFEELAEKAKEIEILNRRLEQKLETQANNLEKVKLLLAETQREVGKVYGLANIIGRSKEMLHLFRILEKVVQTDATVLILGESGTGKELIARYVHYNGSRAEKPIVSVNCSAFSDTLLESELFGHARGAFTDARENKIGLLVVADGGTLFLDELGDMSLEMQKKLLRFLQEGEVRPVGSKETQKVDVRTLAATNKNLKELIRSGQFREDLYYRLNVIALQVPPLRERREDIPLLVEYFTGKISDELGRPLKPVDDSIMSRFLQYDWPGNVRELENELRRVFILGTDYQPQTPEIPREESPADLNLEEMEKRAVLRALEATNGNKSKAAEMLGITRRTFYKKLVRYNIF